MTHPERPVIMNKIDELLAALEYGDYGRWGVSLETRNKAAATIRALREALEFYGDETAWNQPPIKTVHHELLGPAYENQASKVRLDRGRKARTALEASHGRVGEAMRLYVLAAEWDTVRVAAISEIR